MDSAAIKAAVKEALAELSDEGRLRVSGFDYAATQERIRAYYDGAEDEPMRKALSAVREDERFEVIELHLRDGLTIEQTAEELDVDVSTVSRNKRRLCEKIDKLL